jgi:pimeloyl-ACP methyl ester carboxylesterase
LRKAFALLPLLLSLFICQLFTRTPPRPETATVLASLGGTPCPDSDFTCVRLSVPLDHQHPADGRTLRVAFGVLPASGERKGMFVTVTGGPGSSGVALADSYASALDPEILAHFDVVFFDQRGVGLSGGLTCPQAATAFYLADWEAITPEQEGRLMSSAQAFVEGCTAELSDPELLPYLGTGQAIEDLETFRQLMGDEEFWLYGESYGTQFAQTYAAAHPEHLAGLILDGTVDLTLSGPDFLAAQARAFNSVLLDTLQSCDEQGACHQAMGQRSAQAVYDELAARLRQSPLPFDFHLPSGGTAGRELTFSDLESAAAGYLYSEASRMIFLRALADYARDGDLAPMARILYESLSIDPETLRPAPDPTFSDAVYYAVECQDYAYFSGTPQERAEAYLRAGDSLENSLHQMASIFYGDLPCAFWPEARQDPARPAPLAAEDIPTLVLNATTDPATPLSGARAVFSGLDQGRLVVERGGPHVLFGWGKPCVDDLVTAFLVRDRLPTLAETVCDGEISRPFVDLAPASAAGPGSSGDLLSLLAAADDDFYYLPEYYYWDLETATTVGCPAGGTWAFGPLESGEAYSLNDCAFSEGFIMTGNGTYEYGEDQFTLNVTVRGVARGLLTYTRSADGTRRVTGDYAGQVVESSR